MVLTWLEQSNQLRHTVEQTPLGDVLLLLTLLVTSTLLLTLYPALLTVLFPDASAYMVSAMSTFPPI
jgi:hypothetical protein